ncbi:hypothetical protein FY034_10235 [Trichlorobacter lovleyi]|uniref:hypothetical protein n=1 Tax=Trichlorobacter lovleyi TaxID=313985 RepID=UPI0022401156|nr:hypothetical protein [Trichlorobacter lovleyi]QOX79293.1 hypothetical protein FY034_10235 [Trichlorobacter lovleyi]
MKVVSRQTKHLQGTLQGDLKVGVQLNLENDKPKKLDINMTKLIHITSPIDNAKKISRKNCGKGEIHKPPVEIAWEPVVSDAEYIYEIYKGRCEPFSYGDVVARGSTKELFLDINLPVTKSNEFYIFMLTAKKNGIFVGSMETRSRNFLAFDYSFRVIQSGLYYDFLKYISTFTGAQK